VDHPLPAPDALVRPWRTATLVACAVAALELLLLIVLGGALIAKEAAAPSARPKARASKTAAATEEQAAVLHRPKRVPVKAPPVAQLSRSKVRVLVLNGNGRQGAAGAAADRLRRRGYRISAVTNAQRMDYARSLVMYRRGFDGEGVRLGRDLGISIVGPLDGMRPAQVHGAHVVVIVGP
jgi:LytR cell envelope-related transcriptional attenuator